MKTVRERATVTHIQQEKMNNKAMAHILFRGEYDKRKDEVEPGTYGALHPHAGPQRVVEPPFTPGSPRRRLLQHPVPPAKGEYDWM